MLQIQKELDRLEQSSGGGLLLLPPGDYRRQDTIRMPDHCIIKGSSWGVTTIPSVHGKYWKERRQTGIRLEDVNVDGQGGYSAVEWRNITFGGLRHVKASNARFGLLMTSASLYNHIEHCPIGGFEGAVELYGADYLDAPNENAFFGGKLSAPLCLKLQGCNGNSFISVAMERAEPDTVFRHLINAPGNNFIGCRNEKDGYGPVWLTETPPPNLRL